MPPNLFSLRTSNLSPEDALELANEHLDNARNERNPAKVLELINNAKSLLKDAEHTFTSKKVKNPSLSEGIAIAYHEHGRLLDDLGHHDKAKKSRSKAEKWGYVDVVNPRTAASQSLGKRDTIHRSVAPSVAAALSFMPNIATAMHQVITSNASQLNHQDHILHPTPVEVSNSEPTPSKDAVHIPQKIFEQNISPPITKYILPEPNGRITSTPQLAYCLSLLISKEELDQNECDWLQARIDDTDEQERLQSMATDLIRAFVQEGLKKPDVVAEVVSMAAVLGQEDFRKLLQAFVDGINQSVLLDVHLLNGLARLIQNSPRGHIDADDLVKILELLNARLKNTHSQSTQHTYRLALTISQVLDSMVDSQAEGLSREQLHEPLSDYLKGLQQNSDPYLIYQAAYAYQALQYIPDDETILQSMMRRTGKVVRGISGVVSAVKALDLIGFIEGLQSIQQGLVGAEKMIGLVSGTYSNVVALAENGQGLLTSLKECFKFNHKSSWYPALRGLDRLVQEGRFVDFEELVRKAPCQYDPIFRWGVCQRLGEIAANPIWDINTRKCAVDFLKQLYMDDASKDQQIDIKQWILYILNQLAETSKDIFKGSTQEFLGEAQADSDPGKGNLHHGYGNDTLALHLTVVTPPSMESPLLDCVQNKPDVETPLRRLKLERLRGQEGDVYISPRAKATQRATDDFDLTAKVQEFLASDKKVFLVLGDSGAGKSTFNRALEISLWNSYDKINGRIPLFIHLPAIEKPERDLIPETLRKANFTESQILELKLHREFILICDGYDESQQTRNLYMSNQLDQPGKWRTRMVISCRTEYIGVEYKDFFQPTDRNNGGVAGQFQEAIISPFTKEQIYDYIEQYVLLQKSPWQLEDYLQAIEQIPNLQDLMKNPFLLKISLEVLPRLLKRNAKFSSTHITRLQLYDEFVAQWIDRGKIRLGEMELSPYDRRVFKQMTESGFQGHGITYLKELVTAIYEHQDGNPVIHYSSRLDRRTWKEEFFSDRDGNHLLREVIPLTRNGDQYRFIHKSLLEYGLSLAIFGPRKRNEDTEATPSVSRRRSTNSVLSFESPSSTEMASTADDKSLLDSPLGKRNLVGERSILQFLTERVQQEAVFKDQLHSVIERSKTDKSVRIAAANAITILVLARVQFIGADLRNIKIPGADLSFGMFDSAQMEGADLRKVNLRNVWMRQVNLRGAQMKGVQFGELPFLKEKSIVSCSAYSPDGKTYASGLHNGSVSLYETSNWSRIQTLKGHSDWITSLSFSATGDRVASGGSESTVRLWNVDTDEYVHILQGHNERVNSVAYSPKGDWIASGSNDSMVRLWDVDTGECVHILQGHSDSVRSVAYSPNGDRIASGSSDSTVRLWNVDTDEYVHILQGHSGSVRSVVYSPEGDRIASGSNDSTVRLWDVDTGECVHILQGHNERVNSVVYSPKGDRIASGSNDSTVRIWGVDTGECVHILQGHSDSVRSVVYSPEGDRIASGSNDSMLRIWDVDTCDCVHILQGHSDRVRSVAYSPNGDRIASGSSDSTVRLWNVDTDEYVHILQGHSGSVRSVVYSPEGDRIASGSNDSTVRLWDVDTGECVHILQGHNERVNSVVYSPKGDRIASGSNDSTVRIWGVDTGECVHILQGHSDSVRSVVYSPEGDRIASGSNDSTVRIWGVDTGECVHILQGHSDSVRSVVYSPEGDRIASGSNDSTVRLWDVDTGECVHILQGHNERVNSVVYSPKGDRIASGSNDSTVRIWGVDTGECVHILQGHSDSVRSVVYSPEGDRIASGSNDSMLRIWDVDTCDCVHILQGHSDRVRSVAYSPNGDRIASGSSDSTVRLWNVDTDEYVHILQGHSGSVRSVVYSPEGDRIASGSNDSTVRLWDVDTGECVHILQGHNERVNSVVYSPKGDRIASGSNDSTVRIWGVDTGECVHILQGHSDSVRSVVYSPEGDRIASGSNDSMLRIWDVDTCDCVHILQGHSDRVRSVAYSPNGDRIASGSSDSTVRLWNVDTDEYVHILQGHNERVNSVVYSPKGGKIASGSNDSKLRLWDVDTGECIHTLHGHSDSVRSVVYSPKGDRIASGSNDSTVRLWDADTGECVHILHGHSDIVRSVVYSPNGDQIASGSFDSTVRLWDVDTGECIHTLQGHSDIIWSAVYSPKGDRIASGSFDSTVRLWDVDTGECIHTLQGHSNYFWSVVYSPKGDRIASGSNDSTVRLWDVDTGECVHILQGHSDPVRSVVYSPKGDQTASRSDDCTVRLWDVDTGKCVHTLQGHSERVNSVVYSPKGDWVVSGSDDRTVKLWNVETGQCLVTISGFNKAITSIALEGNFGAQFLVTGCADNSVRRWRITKEGDEHVASLCWSSSHEALTVSGLSFEDAQGLSRLNQELLIQRGAFGPKSSTL